MDSSTTWDRAAVLLASLPAADAEQLLQRMPAAQAAALRRCATDCQTTPARRIATVRQFIQELSQNGTKSKRIRIDAADRHLACHTLTRLLPSRLAEHLHRELPRTTAAILSTLPASKAADVLALLPEEYQAAVVEQLLCSGPLNQEVLSDLARALAEIVAAQDAAEGHRTQRRERLTALLRCADDQTRRRLAAVAREAGIEIDVD